MISPHEFLTRWRDTELLVRYDPAVVEKLSISEASQKFLITAGLPSGWKNNSSDLITPSLPDLKEAYGARCNLSPTCEHFRVLSREIADKYVSGFLCLDEQANGKIFSVDFDYIAAEYIPLFANSSVQQYAEFLLILKEYQDHYDKLQKRALMTETDWTGKSLVDCEELAEYGGRIAQKLYEVDPEACQDDSLWTNDYLSLKEEGILS